ncbi:MAG: exopolyphosphatase [Desulfobacter sp.]|nr:MAG: exopolyphosphatase [Desulfobacter sp.]
MRIVTRPDFDGIVCAVFLLEALDPDMEIFWIEPNQIQSGSADIREGDIIANLPWHPKAALWFDHHVSNKPDHPVPGAFDIAPSAAGVIYQYYKELGKLDNRFDELAEQTDIIDSAALTKEQVLAPENFPYIILSMTIQNRDFQDIPYWNRLVDMLRKPGIETIMSDPEVAKRCREVVNENNEFGGHLKAHTTLAGNISVTDFRSLDPVPSGNRFLTYSLFPDTVASVKIRYKAPDKAQVLISVGHSIFNPHCKVNVGKLLSRYGGGGHAGAGGCTLDADGAQEKIDEILAVLKAN